MLNTSRTLSLLFATVALACGGSPRAAAPEPAAPTISEEEASTPKVEEHPGYTGETQRSLEDLGSAPDVQVLGSDGQTLSLADTWAEGPSVIVFYRGHW